MKISKCLFILLVVFHFRPCAAAIDTSVYSRIVNECQQKFCKVLDANDCAIAHGELSKMQFVVMVDGNSTNYADGFSFGDNSTPVTQSPILDSINAAMSQIYQQYGLELYFLYIKGLNVKITATFPDSATANQVFTTHMYDDRSNAAMMEQVHEQVATSIVNNSISPRQRDCIILSQATFEGMFHGDGKKSVWKYCKMFKHISTERTFADLNPVFTDFYRRSQEGGWNEEDEFYRTKKVMNDFRETLQSDKVRSYILHTYDPDLLKYLLNQLDYPHGYQDLTLAERKHILSVFSGYPMLADYFGNVGEERYTIRTIISTPKNDVEGLLTVLSNENYLDNDTNYRGGKSSNALIFTLMYRIDDSYWSEDNDYTKFVKAISDLMMSSDEVIKNHLPQTDAEWMRRKINWGGTTEGGLEDIGYQKYDVALYSNGTLQVSSHIVSGWTRIGSSNVNSSGVHPYEVNWSDNGNFTLNPFDLVFFTNRSEVSMLERAGVHRGSVKAVPAIFLKYAADKQFNQNITEAVTTTLYIGGTAVGILATGGQLVTAIEAADFALAAYAAAQFIGVAGQIAADAIGDPDLKNLCMAYNSIIGIWGVGELLANSSELAPELMTQVKAGTIRQIPEGTATNFEGDFSLAESKLEQLNEADQSRLKEMEEYLGDNVAAPYTFSQQQINDFVEFATKNPSKNKVMLGRWDNGAPSSYVNRAGTDYSYFAMEDRWAVASGMVNGNVDELWRINKEFIDQQKSLGKDFFFSHNPFSPGNETYFAKEVNYLIDLGVQEFENAGPNLWKAKW